MQRRARSQLIQSKKSNSKDRPKGFEITARRAGETANSISSDRQRIRDLDQQLRRYQQATATL
jgi:hypothetical protein